MSVWKELWDNLGATPAEAGLKPGSMWFAARGTIFVGFVAVSCMFLKGCGWAGWIPACLPCWRCGNPAGARGDVGSDGETEQPGSLQHMAGLERSRGVLHSYNPDGRKQEAFWGLRGNTFHRPRNYLKPLALISGLEGRLCPLRDGVS